jgi:3-oxoacyl-[acyl-carrier protein] reductase
MRNVVVSGGATGIGYAIAETFAGAGDAVLITGRRAQVLEEAAARLGAVSVRFDASDPVDVAAAMSELPESVDVLVNNVGGNYDFDRPEAADLETLAANWRANFEGNVLSAVLMTEALKSRLTAHARVVSIGSIAARLGAGSYGAAKAALEAWTADLAGELGPRGITVNVVSPGLIIDTEFFRNRMTEDGIHRRVAQTKNGRPGTPTDVAALVSFLASPDAGHITGQVLHVNGGAYLGR